MYMKAKILSALIEAGHLDLAQALAEASKPTEPGQFEQTEDSFVLTYPDHRIDFYVDNGEPQAMVESSGVDVDHAAGKDAVYDLVGNYAHPADMEEIWNLFGDKFGIGR